VLPQDFAVYKAQHKALEQKVADLQDALAAVEADKSTLLDYVQVGTDGGVCPWLYVLQCCCSCPPPDIRGHEDHSQARTPGHHGVAISRWSFISQSYHTLD
jgi:hypothetical protein